MDGFEDSIVVPLSIFSTFAIAANLLVCFLVFSQRKMRAYCNRFVVSLAMSDIITGITMLIQYNVELHNLSRNIVNVIYNFVFLCGALNLCAVTYERYLAVMRPFKYKTIIAKVFKRSVPSIWLMSLLVSVLPFTWQAEGNNGLYLIHQIYVLTTLVGVSVVCYGFILVANFCIFRVVRQSVRREKELFLAVHALNKSYSVRATTRKLYSEAKNARVFVLVALVFILSWFPTIFYSSAAVLGRKESVPAGILHMSPFVVVLGSAVNPIIYSFMKPDFRKALQKSFCKTPSAV